MRFKRLRLYIAVAFVVFLIIAANIIVLGSVENKLLADIDKRKCPIVIESINNTINQTSQQPSTPSTPSTPTGVTLPAQPPQTPTPVPTGTTTRAS